MKAYAYNSVDSLDLALIRELEIDARQSGLELAAKLNTSPTTVRRRLQRLQNEAIIRIATIPDPLPLGYATQVTIVINVNAGKVDAVADELARYRNIQYVVVTTGRYDIFAWGVFRSQEELYDFVRTGLGSIPDLASAETMTSLKTVKSSWALLTTEQPDIRKDHPNRPLSKLDFKLIGELESEARRTDTELAARLGASRPTVRKRVRSLLDDGVIKIVSIADPFVLGYQTEAGLLLKVHPAKIESVAGELASNRRIRHVIVHTGRYDIIAWAVFSDSEDMSSFIRTRLGQIPGVISHETVINLRVAKGTFTLMNDAD